ncbi:MAG TPA: N-acetylmuramoyl-L-alanine amidase [Acidimicrobiia bacterium]|jgi:hypothetical protein
MTGPDDHAASRDAVSRREVLRWSAGAATVGALGATGATLVDLVESEPAVAARPRQNLSWPVPPIVTRAEWGADEHLRKAAPDYDSVVQKLIVHHTVTPNGPRDPAAVVRSVMAFHTSREYIDIAYNFLIDEHGRIYEGRWARDYPPGVPHTTESRWHRQVRGAHALYFNNRTIGIALLGTFTHVAPPQPMLHGLIELLAWKCARWGIDPQGQSNYVDSQGRHHMMRNIVGHRDTYATLCPGGPTEALLPHVRHAVAGRLEARNALLTRRHHGPFWAVAHDGTIVSAGGARPLTDWRAHGLGVVGVAHSHAGGMWLLTPDGAVLAEGGAPFHGDLAGRALHAPAVGIAGTKSGRGYWIVARDGGVFTFGDAGYHGSLGNRRLWAPIVAIAGTRKGRGYWLLGADGGVFTFGDAGFHGSAAVHHAGDDAVVLLPSASGHGYHIVHRSGRLRHFGDALRIWLPTPPGAHVMGLVPSARGHGVGAITAEGSFLAAGDFPIIESVRPRIGSAPVVGVAGTF